MDQQLEGSQAIARAVGLCRPQVISCYPITPQTHIVETLSAMVKDRRLPGCEFINVESEFSALSVLIGASAVGARTYTATASQGLLFMAEAVYNAAGLGLPLVMTIGNRAIGAPINIWNDHSDSMAMRDAGWIQLYASSNQEAVDLHIQAFRLAEELSCPVMVCVDGFVLTHAFERVRLPEQEEVDRFLPPYDPVQVLDPADPLSIGAMVGPEAFYEVRYLAHQKQLKALELIPQLQQEYEALTGRASGGLLHGYHHEDAELIMVALGSETGTLMDVVDELRGEGLRVGCIDLCAFRPFPYDALRELLQSARSIVSIEKNLSVGQGGVVAGNISRAVRGREVSIHTVIAGLGGRPVTRASVKQLIKRIFSEGELEEPYFLDLKRDVVDRELTRQHEKRRSGPVAENIIRDLALTGGARE